jgi:hypothetical protein
MSLGNGNTVTNPFTFNSIEVFDINGYARDSLDYGFQARFRAEVLITSGTVVPYRFVFLIDGQRVYESPLVTNINQIITFNTSILDFGIYQFEYIIESTNVFTATVNTEYVSFVYGRGNSVDTVDSEFRTKSVTTTVPILEIKKQISDMKVVDWFAAIVKAFNLTIEPLDNGTLLVNDLPSWYNTGSIIDVSDYVDIETLDVSRGKLYNEVNFGYKDQESLLAEQYEAEFGQQFGGFENDFEGINSEDSLTIELPFENPQFERLYPSTNQYGFIVDKDLQTYKNAPFLLYAPNLQLTTSNLIGFSGNTYVPLVTINTPSHAINLVDGFTAQFNAEFNEYNGSLLSDNLYTRFYNDYLTDIFSPQRRQYTINANLPVNIASNLRLNDRLIIKGDRYIIDNIDSDLTTGISKLVLLNDLFTKLEVGDISKLSQVSGSFKSSGSVYYTGAEFAEVVTADSFITLASSTISSGQNISFTLSDNKTGAARAGVIEVIDNLNYPTITVFQDKTGFITFSSKTIFWNNTTLTFND